MFLADRAAIEDDQATSAPRSALEPAVLLAAMARETSRVGLVATSSTTYNYPYTVARQFRALDLVSGGRIGWNAVTTSSPLAALNHAEEVPSREYRYGRAHEFVTAVQALWGSWQDDALVLDAERDLLPQRALAGKVVLPLAIGGTLTHAPVIDYALGPVLTTLGTTEVPVPVSRMLRSASGFPVQVTRGDDFQDPRRRGDRS